MSYSTKIPALLHEVGVQVERYNPDQGVYEIRGHQLEKLLEMARREEKRRLYSRVDL